MTQQCTLCGKCLEVCPLLDATGKEELAPRSKGQLARRLLADPKELAEADVARLAGLCLSCGRCREACPQQRDTPAFVAELRHAHPTFAIALWKLWLTRAGLIWPGAALLAKALPEGLTPARLGVALKGLRGLSGARRAEPFVAVAPNPASPWRGREVLLFAGCGADYLSKRWKAAAVGLMDRLGMKRVDADFGCCGSSLGSAGLSADLDAAARRNISAWRAAGRRPVAVFCASCLHGLGAYAGRPELFEGPDEAAAFAAALTPLAACFHDARFVLSDSAPERVGYHRPCHMPAAKDPDRALLTAALGPRLVRLTDACCGFGGVMQLAAPQYSAAVAGRRWQRAATTAAGKPAPLPGLVLTGCTACVTQLAATAPEGVVAAHWLDTMIP
ncbi:MAG: (Fe-S)-binding protein [Desulfovibrionaceae bacterium]